jgi:hypothetical protein
MKVSQLRAIAHNLADSLSSEDSRFLGYGIEPSLWDNIDRLPQRRLRVDLLTGDVDAQSIPAKLQAHLRTFAKHAAEFILEQELDPLDISAMEVEYRRAPEVLPSRKEALVIIERMDGKKIEDRYVGDPLKRPRYVDGLGRIRTDRRKPS